MNQTILVKINGDASGFERAVGKSIGLSKQFAGAMGLSFGVAGLVAFSKQLIDISDRYTQLDGRLRLVTKSTAEFQAAQSGLYKVAQDTRVSYEATADLYTRLARSTDGLGVSQSQLLGITDSINKALIVSGASGESASAALMQLGQGMASGALRGEELNSVMEQTPRLAQMIADGLGVGIGQLREMGKEGKLTSDVLVGALQKGAAKVNEEFGKMPTTVGQAMTKLSNAFNSVVNDSNNAAGATGSIAGAIDQLAATIESNKGGIINGVVAIAEAARVAAEQFARLGNFIAKNPGSGGAMAGGIGGASLGYGIAGGPGALLGAGIGSTTGGVYSYLSDQAQKYPYVLGMKSRVYKDRKNRGATASWGDPEPESTITAPKPVRGGAGTGGSRRSGGSKGASEADKLKERIEALRTSLMTEAELENKRYAQGVKDIQRFYGDRAKLTQEDDELRLKLAEDHQKKMDEIAGVTKWQTDLEALQDRFKTEAELEDERYKEQIERLTEFLDEGQITKEEYLAREIEALDAHQKEKARIQQAEADKEQEVQQSIRAMRMQTAEMAVSLIAQVAGKSKAAAIAVIALEKGLAIAQTIMNTEVAKMKALAQLGPIAGPPAAAAIGVMGKVQIGLIAATGLMQAASVSGGSSSTLSASGSGASYTTSSDGTTTSEMTTSNKTVTIYGLDKDSLYTGEQVAKVLNEFLADGGKLNIK